MDNRVDTIRKMVRKLNNSDEDGGFWLPNIQRSFVWNEGQIERLFDSIMREYPISTLLVWKTNSSIKTRKFIDNYQKGLKLTAFFVPEDNKLKKLVLDGQQRLQSLFIGLKGTYEKKELYFNSLSNALASTEDLNDDVKYEFKFMDSKSKEASLPWIKLKDLVYDEEDTITLAEEKINAFNYELTKEEKILVSKNIAQVVKVFGTQDNITYQEIDSIDRPNLYTEDDVVEVFIRANSGGTKLSKSDLLFSLLTVKWEDADEMMEELLEDLNRTGYYFNRDFILKTCLSILHKGAAYNVAKFRDKNTRDTIISEWEEISKSIKDVKDFLWESTYIRSNKALPSYLALIPLIYFRYHYKKKWSNAEDLDDYILRTLISGAFSGTPDNLIDKCTKNIDLKEDFIVKDIYGVIRADGRNLEVSKDTILKQGYTSKNIHLYFNLWYKDFDYRPSAKDNSPQIDHIFPQSALKSIKTPNPETGAMNILKYKASDRNQIANCMLLKQRENGPGGKGDQLPVEWFADKPDKYLEKHLIPDNKDLWKLENYEAFIEERKKLIEDKFSYLILKE